MPKHWIPLPSIKTTLIIVIVIVYTLVLTSLFVVIIDGSNLLRMPTIGNIITIGYKAHGGDIRTIAKNQTLNCGTIYVGTPTNRSFILKSESNTITIPHLNTTDWAFNDTTAPSQFLNDIELNWTLNHTPFNPGEERNVTLTLNVKYDQTLVDYLINNNIRTFNYVIIIEPSEV